MSRAFATLLLATLAACGTSAADGTDIVLTAAGAGNPTVAVNPAGGDAYAAWIETSDTGSDVYVAAVARGVRGAAVRVNDIPGDAAPHDQAPPQVELGPDGALYVVWQNNTVIPDRRFPASNLRFARSLDGGRTFAPAVFVNDDALGEPTSHTFQDMAVAADGTIYVSWIDGRTRAQAEAGAPAHAHGVAMPGSEVRVAKSSDGGRTFTSGVIVHRDACPCCRTSLAVAPDGTVAVAFRTATRNVRDIVVVRSSDAGATFGEPLIVHDDGWVVNACPHAGASLAFAADGRMHIAWYTGVDQRQGLWYARSTEDGTAFEPPQPLETGGWVPVSQVKLAAAPAGDVWIAWDDRREETSAVRLAVARDGTVRELAGTIAGKSPAIAAADDVIVGWQNDAGAAVRVIRPR